VKLVELDPFPDDPVSMTIGPVFAELVGADEHRSRELGIICFSFSFSFQGSQFLELHLFK